MASVMVFSMASWPYLSTSALLLDPWVMQPAPPMQPLSQAMPSIKLLGSTFLLARSKAASLIQTGKVSVNHRECLKADKLVEEGDVLTCRGLGKCVLKEVSGTSKKGRIMLVLERYL